MRTTSSTTSKTPQDYSTKIKLRFTTPKKSLKEISEKCQNLNSYQTPKNLKIEAFGKSSNKKLKLMQSTCSNHQMNIFSTPNTKILSQNQSKNFDLQNLNFSKEEEKGKNSSVFLTTDYSSQNLNFLLGSDMKFKSPSKLMEIKISESPWVSNQKRNNFLSQFFENSPLRKNSGYKIGFSERTGSKDLKNFRGRLDNNFYVGRKFSNDFELRPVVEKTPTMDQPCDENNFTVIRKKKIFFGNEKNIEDRDDGRISRGNEAKKRRRKTPQQLKILKDYFVGDQNWSKDKITKIAKITGLSESQVYKWCWDQKKKVEEDGENEIKKDGENQLGGNSYLGKRKPFSQVNDCRMGYIAKKLKLLDNQS